MGRDTALEKIIGIMKPGDGLSISIKDEKEIYYRKYTPQTTGYKHEMFMAICQDAPFHYYQTRLVNMLCQNMIITNKISNNALQLQVARPF